MQTIVDRIQIVLDEQGINQSDLASALKISPGSVSSWMHGKTNPSPQSIDQICSKYGYNPDWLSSGKGEPRSLAIAEQAIVDTLSHAIKYKSSAVDRLIRAIAQAAAAGEDRAIEETLRYLKFISDDYRKQSPPDKEE